MSTITQDVNDARYLGSRKPQQDIFQFCKLLWNGLRVGVLAGEHLADVPQVSALQLNRNILQCWARARNVETLQEHGSAGDGFGGKLHLED